MWLIDTSAWVEFLRADGKPEVADEVASLLSSGEAAACPLVELELRNGTRDADEDAKLAGLFDSIVMFAMDESVWERAVELASTLRRAGVTVPAIDLAIFACADTNGVRVLAQDRHFTMLATHAAQSGVGE